MITKLKITILLLKLLLIHCTKSGVHVSTWTIRAGNSFFFFFVTGSVIHANQRRRDWSKIMLVSFTVSFNCLFSFSSVENVRFWGRWLSGISYRNILVLARVHWFGISGNWGCSREQSTSIPPQPVPQTSGDWWCSSDVCVIMPTEVDSCCPPLEQKMF